MCANPIRRACVEDAHAIATLHTASWQGAYRGILPDALLDGLDVDERAARHRRILAEPRSPEQRAWVIERGGRVVGWASTGPCRDPDLDARAHELYAIYLLPACVGQGYGRALMGHCLADVAGRGHTEMVMWVLTGNARARRFYAAAGFRPDARVPQAEFDGTGAWKLRMVRPLGEA